jgi:CRP/FNR family transcriptional regulator, dissimilatory nitrate respiration regulator
MKTQPFDQEARRILSAVPYFAGLDRRSLETIARSASPRIYDPDQLVLLEGEPASGLHIVQYGWLKVSKIAIDGREQILQLLGSGEVFNAVSVFSGTPNPASVTALESTRLWMITRQAMLRLLDENPAIARLIIQDLAGRVTHLIALVEDLSLRTVEARLARLLLEQSSGDILQRQKWATQTEIASRLGTVPDVLSRTLRKLSERGLIQIGRQEIRILDRQELEAVAMIEG